MPSPENTISPRRLLAVGMALLVFMLGLLAQVPSLHARLHQDVQQTHNGEKTFPQSHDESTCAITLLAQTADTGGATLTVGLLVSHALEQPPVAPQRLHCSEEHLCPPVCGPPALRTV